MLGVLCSRPKPNWILNSLFSHFHHHHNSHNHERLSLNSSNSSAAIRRRHSSSFSIVSGGGAAIFHVIQPSNWRWERRRSGVAEQPRGEGSWNVAWDARPARWLHRPDSAWLLLGVCAYLAPEIEFSNEVNNEGDDGGVDDNNINQKKIEDGDLDKSVVNSADLEQNNSSAADYKVTGVLADGRCLFRAIAHVSCLRNGEDAPDETRQRELADELRAQPICGAEILDYMAGKSGHFVFDEVVDELLKRREETEWFIEGDFDEYVKRLQQPYVWGGEPELLMASHVLKTMISVFMREKTSDNLVNIANYGEEYQKDQAKPINVLFHGYGHYDILETTPDQSYQKVDS